jgi:hypothetical protein
MDRDFVMPLATLVRAAYMTTVFARMFASTVLNVLPLVVAPLVADENVFIEDDSSLIDFVSTSDSTWSRDNADVKASRFFIEDASSFFAISLNDCRLVTMVLLNLNPLMALNRSIAIANLSNELRGSPPSPFATCAIYSRLFKPLLFNLKLLIALNFDIASVYWVSPAKEFSVLKVFVNSLKFFENVAREALAPVIFFSSERRSFSISS